jgi:hypothetical protein
VEPASSKSPKRGLDRPRELESFCSQANTIMTSAQPQTRNRRACRAGSAKSVETSPKRVSTCPRSPNRTHGCVLTCGYMIVVSPTAKAETFRMLEERVDSEVLIGRSERTIASNQSVYVESSQYDERNPDRNALIKVAVNLNAPVPRLAAPDMRQCLEQVGWPAGSLVTNYTYEPFGTTTISGTADAKPYQFTGRENDGTGLTYTALDSTVQEPRSSSLRIRSDPELATPTYMRTLSTTRSSMQIHLALRLPQLALARLPQRCRNLL